MLNNYENAAAVLDFSHWIKEIPRCIYVSMEVILVT